MSGGKTPRRGKPKRQRKLPGKAREVYLAAIVALGTVAIQAGGQVVQVWIEGRGGRP